MILVLATGADDLANVAHEAEHTARLARCRCSPIAGELDANDASQKQAYLLVVLDATWSYAKEMYNVS